MCYLLLIHLKDHQMNNKSKEEKKAATKRKTLKYICMWNKFMPFVFCCCNRCCCCCCCHSIVFLCNTNFMPLHLYIVHYFILFSVINFQCGWHCPFCVSPDCVRCMPHRMIKTLFIVVDYLLMRTIHKLQSRTPGKAFWAYSNEHYILVAR